MTAIRNCFLLLVITATGAVFSHAATFGKVIPIVGHIADIALDEPRGLLYAANFTANRIEVISLADYTLQAPISVAAQPNTIALSPDGRYLVIGHYNTYLVGFLPDPPQDIRRPAITIYDLEMKSQRRIPRDPLPTNLMPGEPLPPDSSPVAIAFGNENRALVISNRQPDPEQPRFGPSFELLDPVTGNRTALGAEPLDSTLAPAPLATFPLEITQAAATASGDGNFIFFQAKALPIDPLLQQFSGRYDVETGVLLVSGGLSNPGPGPMVISVNLDGSQFLADWSMLTGDFAQLAQFPYPTGRLNVGSHAFDSSRNLIYGHIPTDEETNASPSTVPAGDGAVLTIFDADNLTVRERIRLPESLAGKSVLTADSQIMYSISDSGITMLPVGSFNETHRVMALQEDLFFPSSTSDLQPMTRELEVVDPGGGSTSFRLSTNALGVHITPETGTTPMRVRVEVDPSLFFGEHGTTAVSLQIESTAAINIPFPVRLLINTRAEDQVGTLVNVPGKLVDILADPVRDRFYVLRQDMNLVLVFDGSTFEQIASFRTGNTPTQMALTRDAQYLLVGNDNSQIANVYDLELMQPSQFIRYPGGHYPRSIAVSNAAILTASRVAFVCLKAPEEAEKDIQHCMDRVDFTSRTASKYPSLGIYRNEISPETVLAASASGNYIFGAMPDGTVLLYEAASDTFVASRHDLETISGSYAALSDSLFVADNHLLNWNLLPIIQLERESGLSSGLAFFEGHALRTTSPSPTAPGIIQRVDLTTFQGDRSVPLAESPLLSASLATRPIGQVGQTILPFLRTLAPLSNGTSIVSLSVSGFTVLPRDFDVFVPDDPSDPEPGVEPTIDRLVNLADGAAGVASGGLISISGSRFATLSLTAAGTSLPNTLAGASVTANDDRPVPLLFVSPSLIVAQLPFSVVGPATLRVGTSEGVSSPFSFTVLPAAPAIFRTASAGPLTGLPTVFRAVNNEPLTLTNPVHPEDLLTIFLTGLGVTDPAVATGSAAPAEPLASAVLVPQVTIGEVPLPISFAGLAPGYVGLYQINALVPGTVPEGLDIPLTVQQGSYSTTLSVRVVK